MALAPRYERQVADRPGAAMPSGGPDAYGAGFGRSVAELGDTLQRGELASYAVQRRATEDRETAKFMHDFAAYRENMDGISREARKNALPGADGHMEGMAQAVEAGRPTLLDGITEDRVRRMATAQFDEYALRFKTSEADWADVTRADKAVADVKAATDVGANRVLRLADPKDYLSEVDLGHRQIDALNLNIDAKAKLKRDLVDRKYAIAFLRGRIEADPVVAEGLIDKGVFDEVLEPQQIQQLRNGAQVEIRSREVAARAAAAQQKAQVLEQISTLEEYNRQGVTIPDAQIAAASQAAAALGDTSLATRLEGVRASNAFSRVWSNGNATPQQREARLLELSRMGKRSAEQDRELKWLQDHASSLDSAFDRDPVAAIGAQGGAPGFDWNDPASIAGRVAWSRAQTVATGRAVPPFSQNDLQPLQDLMKRDGGRLQVLGVLDHVGDPVAQLEAARMIAPADRTFQQMALIRPQFRERVQRGMEAMKANQALLYPKGRGASAGPGVKLLTGMQQQIDTALVAASPAARGAMHDVAEMYIAGKLDEYGRNGDTITPELIRQAVTVALGGEYRRNAAGEQVRYGGIASWGSRPVFVEDGYTKDDLSRALLSDRARQDKAGTGPVNPDGSRANLGKAYPVWIGQGRYRWETAPNVPVLNAKGDRYVSQVELRQ